MGIVRMTSCLPSGTGEIEQLRLQLAEREDPLTLAGQAKSFHDQVLSSSGGFAIILLADGSLSGRTGPSPVGQHGSRLWIEARRAPGA